MEHTKQEIEQWKANRKSAEVKGLTEDEWNSISTPSYLLGQLVGFEMTASKMRAMAGEAFAMGKDDRANFLREMSITIQKISDDMRKVYDHNFPKD